MESVGITRGAALAISDMLDTCCQIKPGDEVVIASHVDGLHGGDNIVDTQAVAWIQAAIQARDANPTILWIDEPVKPHKWRVPPVFLAALRASDVFINNSFDLTVEEIKAVMETATEYNVTLCRNYATTTGLLNSPWVQTPYELPTEIRYEESKFFGDGNLPFWVTDDNGTHFEGTILPADHPRYPTYTRRRNEGPGYRPFPEWIHPPINLADVNGIIVFDRMLSWWSRYIGISPFFKDPIRLTVENSRITNIEGKNEADALRRFLKDIEAVLGEDAYNVPEMHCGVHPCPVVAPQQCSNTLVQRIVDHSATYCVHFHIGAPWPRRQYPYWMHMTGDLVTATWKIGDNILVDKGHNTVLDLPRIKEIDAKYPDRPGLGPWPKSF